MEDHKKDPSYNGTNGSKEIVFDKLVENSNQLFGYLKSHDEKNFIKLIKELHTEDVDVNLQDDSNNYLLYIAVAINSVDAVKTLIELGARVDVLDSDGFSILYYPIKFGYDEIVDIIVNYDNKSTGISIIDIKDAKGNSPILYCLKFNNIRALKKLLANNANPSSKNKSEYNILHIAVVKRDYLIVELICKYMKNFDTRIKSGDTALHLSCDFKVTDIVKLLLEKGANPNLSEYEHFMTPIFYSIMQNDIHTVEVLINHKIHINHQDFLGNTILHYCIMYKHYELIDIIFNKFSIEQKTNIDNYNENINTQNMSECIDPNLVNADGYSIVHLMIIGYQPVLDKYIEKTLPKNKLYIQDNNGNTIIHDMIDNGTFLKFRNILRKKKINMYISNLDGVTPLDMINLSDIDLYLDIVAEGYYNYLKKHPEKWEDKWQNMCSIGKISEKECIDKIKSSIMNDKTSLPTKTNKIKIIVDVGRGDDVNYSTFVGNLLDLICGLKFLEKKHPSCTSLFHKNRSYSKELEEFNHSMGIIENLSQHIVHIEIKWIQHRMFVFFDMDDIISRIIKNGKHRFIIIPIAIVLAGEAHTGMLIYDIETQTMERFEPHGSRYPFRYNYNPELLDYLLIKKFNSLLSKIYDKKIKIKYYHPSDYLPEVGLQKFENVELHINKNIGDPNGFCTSWCIWYMDYRILHKNENPKYIIKHLIRQIKTSTFSFRQVIRNYSKQITDLRDDYLRQINRDINDFENNRLTQPELDKLTNIIMDS